MQEIAKNKDGTLLSVKDLIVEYHSAGETVHAVNGVSFDLEPGETIGLVGETGAGKTTIAKALLRILPDRSTQRCDGIVLRAKISPPSLKKKCAAFADTIFQ